MENYYVETIIELNRELEKFENPDNFCFTYGTNGDQELIFFQDQVIWNSDEDSVTDINDYLTPYVKKNFNDYVDSLVKLKFKKIKFKDYGNNR